MRFAMRLLIDLQSCQNGSRHRGIGHYRLGPAKALCGTKGAHQAQSASASLFHRPVFNLGHLF
jgi:hypothetical protein